MNHTLDVLIEESDSATRVLSPAVGLFLAELSRGAFVRGGDEIGRLQVLGRFHRLVLPAGAHGFAQVPQRSWRRTPVAYGEELLRLEAGGIELEESESAEATASAELGGLRVLCSQSGRFYSRPAPDQPPFVSAGEEVHAGQPLGLIEVMKTFTQITYGGTGLPERARVVKILVADETEVQQGEPLLLVEEL